MQHTTTICVGIQCLELPKASAVFDTQAGKLLGEVQRRSKPRIGKKKKEREDCQAGHNI